MVCAEHRLVQTHRRELEFAISMDFFNLILEGSFSVLKTQRSFFSAFCSCQCPVCLSQAALSPQVLGELLRGVHSMSFGDPMVWGPQSWDAEMWDVPVSW